MPALFTIGIGEPRNGCQRVWMLITQHAPSRVYHIRFECLGLVVLALGVERGRQVARCDERVGMVFTQHPLATRQHIVLNLHRIIKSALTVVGCGKVVGSRQGVWMLGTQETLPCGQDTFLHLGRSLKVPLRAECVGQVAQRRKGFGMVIAIHFLSGFKNIALNPFRFIKLALKAVGCRQVVGFTQHHLVVRASGAPKDAQHINLQRLALGQSSTLTQCHTQVGRRRESIGVVDRPVRYTRIPRSRQSELQVARKALLAGGAVDPTRIIFRIVIGHVSRQLDKAVEMDRPRFTTTTASTLNDITIAPKADRAVLWVGTRVERLVHHRGLLCHRLLVHDVSRMALLCKGLGSHG
eukprot:m.22788 g.22788  ORF g.22788 m.22788 type:complete len:353 (+) comp4029_c0_seq1:974-2032(+)